MGVTDALTKGEQSRAVGCGYAITLREEIL